MSVRSKSLRWVQGEEGWPPDPVLVIEARGIHDVYRLAHHMEHGQVEFVAIGRKVKRGLRRYLSKDGWNWLLDYMHGSGGFR